MIMSYYVSNGYNFVDISFEPTARIDESEDQSRQTVSSNAAWNTRSITKVLYSPENGPGALKTKTNGNRTLGNYKSNGLSEKYYFTIVFLADSKMLSVGTELNCVNFPFKPVFVNYCLRY